jgi:hypothetical protein
LSELESKRNKTNSQKCCLILTSGLKLALAMARITVVGLQKVNQIDISEQCHRLMTGIQNDSNQIIRSEDCGNNCLPAQVLPESDAIGVVDVACLRL